MKHIITIVTPYMLEKVLAALDDETLESCDIREVKGYGRQKSYLDEYRGSEYSRAFLPKVEIVLRVPDERSDEIVRKMVEVTRTGRQGDGKIFVLPISEHHIFNL